jgi:hypothetical protein
MSDTRKPADPDTTRAVQAVCALLASAFAGVGAKVMFEGDYVRGPIGIALGVFFAVAGVSVHWWKDRVSRRSFTWFAQVAVDHWGISPNWSNCSTLTAYRLSRSPDLRDGRYTCPPQGPHHQCAFSTASTDVTPAIIEPVIAISAGTPRGNSMLISEAMKIAAMGRAMTK